jgi:cell wall-associated NlpC family hydrolase
LPLEPARVIEVAQRFVGAPYRWGGQTPNGVDCSGYVQQVYDLSGHRLPRLADDQYAQTVPVSTELAQPGDLVFFSTYAPGPSHVGIFLGNGRFLHASSSHGVIEANLSEPYFASRCLGIRRIKDWAAADPAARALPVQAQGPAEPGPPLSPESLSAGSPR